MDTRLTGADAGTSLLVLRAVTHPTVRRRGLAGVLGALCEALGADACWVSTTSPVRQYRHDADGLRQLEGAQFGAPGDAVRHDVRRGGRVVASIVVDGVADAAVAAAALAQVADDVVAAVQDEVDAATAAEATQAMRELERLRDVLEAVPDGLALVNEDGRVVAWNLAMGELTGVRASDALLQDWEGLLDLDGEDGAPAPGGGEAWRRAREGVPSTRDVLRLRPRGRDGSAWVELGFAPTRGAALPVHSVAIVLRDVTVQHDVDRLKDDFLATASHELRTPLTPLRGILELLERGVELEAEQRATLLAAGRRQVDRFVRLADDVITMATLDRRPRPLELVEVDIHEVVAMLAAGHGAEATIEVLRSGPATLWTVRSELARLVGCLLDNAVTHGGGEVEIEVASSDGHVRIAVRDRGPGIPAPLLEQALRPFERLGSHLHRSQGPGLGLSIAAATADRLGGRLEIGARDGGGLEAVAELPALANAREG